MKRKDQNRTKEKQELNVKEKRKFLKNSCKKEKNKREGIKRLKKILREKK